MTKTEKNNATEIQPRKNYVSFSKPIKQGETEITGVSLRRPSGGELRGLKLADVAQLDVGAMIELIPRISIPSLNSDEVAALDIADLTALSIEVGSFLVPNPQSQTV